MGSSQDFPYNCHLSGCKSVGGGGEDGVRVGVVVGISSKDMPSEKTDNPFAKYFLCFHDMADISPWQH